MRSTSATSPTVISCSGSMWPPAVSEVATVPGHTAHERTPRGLSSAFMAELKPTRPAFVAEYTDSHGCGATAAREHTLTTQAPRCSAPASSRRLTPSR